jgi:hypothetical protein
MLRKKDEKGVRTLLGQALCNGWEYWYYHDATGGDHPLDRLRELVRSTMAL